jgi:hypothetical protein
MKNLKETIDKNENEIYTVAEKFKLQINKLHKTDVLPEENPELNERIAKGIDYFLEKIDKIPSYFIQTNPFETDNKTVAKTIDDALLNLKKDIFIKNECLKNSLSGFNSLAYIQTKANAELDFDKPSAFNPFTKNNLREDVKNPALYAELKKWRDTLAEENGMTTYMILPFKVMALLSELLPTTIPELETIKGLGKMKVKQFGNELIEIISKFVEKSGIEKPNIEIKISEPKEPKINSKKLSFDMFQMGKSIEEIAIERNLAISTVEGHLGTYIKTGELEIFRLLTDEKIKKISPYFEELPESTLGEAKTHFGDECSYSELKFVRDYLEFRTKQEN